MPSLQQPYDHEPVERVIIEKAKRVSVDVCPSIIHKAPTLGDLLFTLNELVAAYPELVDEEWYGFDDENLYFKNFIIQPS